MFSHLNGDPNALFLRLRSAHAAMPDQELQSVNRGRGRECRIGLAAWNAFHWTAVNRLYLLLGYQFYNSWLLTGFSNVCHMTNCQSIEDKR
jgi:hypothetical protein